MSADDNVFSVSEVNKHLKNVIENMMSSVKIEGEISNFAKPSSGHYYFSLKDEYSSIKCVFFKPYNLYIKFSPKNGDKVICSGKITVYERDGVYQIQVMSMTPSGQGALQLQFEKLKKKLHDEGLFDPSRKKAIPQNPAKIGIITSASGAAFQDICNVIKRRYPAHLILFPATVQGDKAPSELIAGLEYFNQSGLVDVIVLTRGGGSQEDLFCFNDEQLARAIDRSTIPVISAVGHEIDFTIADFVADLRAPTPSAAAELVVPDKNEIFLQIKNQEKHLIRSVSFCISQYQNMIQKHENKMKERHPQKLIYIYQQALDQHSMKLMKSLTYVHLQKSKLFHLKSKLDQLHPLKQIMRLKNQLNNHVRSLSKVNELMNENNKKIDQMHFHLSILFQKFSEQKLRIQKEKLSRHESSMTHNLSKKLINCHHQLKEMEMLLAEFSPKRALEKGYSLIKKEKKIIRSVKQLKINDSVNIDLRDGACECIIENIHSN